MQRSDVKIPWVCCDICALVFTIYPQISFRQIKVAEKLKIHPTFFDRGWSNLPAFVSFMHKSWSARNMMLFDTFIILLGFRPRAGRGLFLLVNAFRATFVFARRQAVVKLGGRGRGGVQVICFLFLDLGGGRTRRLVAKIVSERGWMMEMWYDDVRQTPIISKGSKKTHKQIYDIILIIIG